MEGCQVSQTKRLNAFLEPDENGPYVYYTDYAALAAEKATNDAEFCEMKQDYLQLRIKNAALAAENERLRKAGDAMAERIDADGQPHLETDDWDAAKEGKSV